MDVNGTKFHLLLSEDDWGACGDGRDTLSAPGEAQYGDARLTDVVWNRERAELTLRPLLFQFVTPPKDVPPSLHVRRGAARDRFGNWYWIDSTVRRVQVFRADTQPSGPSWPPAEAPFVPQAPPPGESAPGEAQTPSFCASSG